MNFDFSPDDPTTGRLAVTVDSRPPSTPATRSATTPCAAPTCSRSPSTRRRSFLATQFAKTANGYEAIGKLTIRDVTHDARVPFTFRTASEGGANVAYMVGKTSLKRLDYGVGQGDWKATDQVGNDVGVSFALRLMPAAALRGLPL